MATTELSLTATPGKPHVFLAKSPAVFFLPDLELILQLNRSYDAALSLRRSISGAISLNRSADYILDITNESQ